MRGLPSRSLGNAPVFPSAKDPNAPTPKNTFQVWLRRAKARVIASEPPEARAYLKTRLLEKRAHVRDPNFRSLPPKVQEAFVGTKHSTLRDVYDEVTSEDLRKARGYPPPATGGSGGDRNRESEPRMNNGMG